MRKSLQRFHHALKNYEIDENGIIYNHDIPLAFSTTFTYAGKTRKLEKLIATCFIDNPDNLRTVVFIDGNIENYNIDNLRWSPITQEYHNLLENENIETKICLRCNLLKPVTDFDKGPTAIKTICKKCAYEKRKIKKDIYNINKQKIRNNNKLKDNLSAKQYNKLKYEELKKNPEKYKDFLEKAAQYRKDNWKIETLSRLKSRALKNGFPFNLTKEDLIVPELCPILEIEIAVRHPNNKQCVSWDRIIPELGYVTGNVKAISKLANTMKQNASFEELKLFAKNIIKYIE